MNIIIGGEMKHDLKKTVKSKAERSENAENANAAKKSDASLASQNVESAQAKPLENQARQETPPPPVPADTTATTTERVIEFLKNYNMKTSDENVAMLKHMAENGIPLTKENIQKMNQAIKLTQSQEKALFMMQNNIRLTQANVAQLDSLISGKFRITDQLSNLMAAIDGMDDTALASKLKNILTNVNQPGEGTPEATAKQNMQPTPGNVATASQPAQTTAATPSTPAMPETAAPPQNNAPQSTPGTLTQPSTAQTAPQSTPAQPGTAQPSPASPQATMPHPPQQLPNQVGQPEATQQNQPAAQNQPTQPQQTTQQPSANPTQPQQTTQPSPANPTQPPPLAEQPIQQQAQPTSTAQPSPPSSTQATAQPPQSSPTLPPSNPVFNLADSTPQDIDRFLNNLRNALTEVQQQLRNANTPDAGRVLQEARTLESHTEFTAQIRDQLFVQLPLFHNGQQTQTTLHIYKDGKKSTSAGGTGENSSALIALETAGMGHFETYVQKKSNSVHCQFRLENEAVAKAVRDNIHKLDELLKNHNYSLDSFIFLPADEPYTLLDDPKKFEENKNGEDEEVIHFDRRV